MKKVVTYEFYSHPKGHLSVKIIIKHHVRKNSGTILLMKEDTCSYQKIFTS